MDLKFHRISGIDSVDYSLQLAESFETILKWKKIFAKITLDLILPLSIMFVAEMDISNRLFHKIERGTRTRGQIDGSDEVLYLVCKLHYGEGIDVSTNLGESQQAFKIGEGIQPQPASPG
ncbi:hypothetical protein L6452_44603 [Arctium lappa]|uniref:Uncharacterized protein n=1 Tax=Arctium lappa TaxID=4217 RepID=A0ACB8XGX8_ARCLA|nr:hypothetical protein L6452_44603 [Arctium lappa]